MFNKNSKNLKKMTFFKNLTKHSLVIMALFVAGACTDLDPINNDSIISEETDEGFVPGNPTELLDGIYNTLTDFKSQENLFSMMSHSSNELIGPTRGVDWGDNGIWRSLHQHTWDAQHLFIRNTWNQLNEKAFRANEVLASSPTPQEAAEAKFLRAWFTWHVLDFWGQVPFREVTDGVDVDPVVLTRAEAVDFALKDLNEAIPDLPSVSPLGFGNGKANKAAAYFLKARILLNKAVYMQPLESAAGPYTFNAADMTEVVNAVDAITAEGYSIDDSYFDIFSGGAQKFTTGPTNEIIFAISAEPTERFGMTLHYHMSFSGWNGFTTIASFYDAFEAGDERLGAGPGTTGYTFNAADFLTPSVTHSGMGFGFLIGQQYGDAGNALLDRSENPLVFTKDIPILGANEIQGVRVLKYHPGTSIGNYIFMRYSEAHLMKAEAILRGGTGSPSATVLVNDLRALRGLGTIGSVTEADLAGEYSKELYWEGIARIHQIRFGTFSSAWEEKDIVDPTKVLFPVPQEALSSNPNLTVNPGY